MAYRNLIDQHVHTDNSFDGHHNVMFICEKALERNLRGVAFTDHVEVDAKDKVWRHTTVPSYIETMKARSAFTGRLIVSTGVELGQAVYNPELAQSIVDALQYDLVLGSIHNLPNMEDFYFLDYTQHDPEQLLEAYFQQELALAEWNGFDSLAHLTYPLRYIVGDQKIPVDLKRYDAIIEQILRTLVRNEKALEINVSGLRQKLRTVMPDQRYIKWFHDLGGKYITIGSDAHYAYDVGLDCEAGLQLAYDCGFRTFSLYEHHVPVQVTII